MTSHVSNFTRDAMPTDAFFTTFNSRRGCLGRWWYREADERLAALCSHAPATGIDADWFVAQSLAWVYKYILPVETDGVRQTIEQTLLKMSGDCGDMALLLYTVLVAGLPEADQTRATLVQGVHHWDASRGLHEWVDWTLGNGVHCALDATVAGEPDYDASKWTITHRGEVQTIADLVPQQGTAEA